MTAVPAVATPRPAPDPLHHRSAHQATGLLAAFNAAGVIDAADVHVAQRLAALAQEPDPRVALAVALVVRAVRAGSVCVDLAAVAAEAARDLDVDPADGPADGPADDPADGPDRPVGSVGSVAELPWPDPETWLDAVRASPLFSDPPVLRLLGDRLLYLDRYWREEQQVCDDLLGRPVPEPMTPAAGALLEAGLDRVLAEADPARPTHGEQRDAARIALTQATTVLTGGPGTGKTTTVAALLALLTEQAEAEGRPRLRMALAAPTGRAAARLQEAVLTQVAALPPSDAARVSTVAGGIRAVTLHRLLGYRPGSSSRFKHHRDNRLPHDVVIVDEASMVSLTMMARLLEAVRPTSRLILVGDPGQLTSVEAGAVLADLVEGLGDRPGLAVAALATSHRYGESIGALAAAVRDGDADRTIDLLRAGGEHVGFVEADADAALHALLVPHAVELVGAAEAGDQTRALSLLDARRLLCAHREGPFGVRHWNQQVERWLGEVTGQPPWVTTYPGRPLLVTANDYGLGVNNGDSGVVVRRPSDGTLRAIIAGAGAPLDLATSRLGEVDTMHALTIHKSQGGQADEVVVVLPPPDSRLLTRELLYTALTRARERVVLVGSADDVRAAVGRRALRATGLARRLAAP